MEKNRCLLRIVLSILLLLNIGTGVATAQGPDTEATPSPQGAVSGTFTYQGKLALNGNPVNAACQAAFRLYDSPSAGNELGAITSTIAVAQGLFTQALDFGTDVFNGDARWLGIKVQCQGDAGFSDLGRQALTAAPYALTANRAPWSGITGMPADFADGVDNVTTYTVDIGLDLDGNQFSLNPGYRLPQACINGQVAVWNGSTWECSTAANGDITGVYAGSGLTGGGTSGEVTLTVAYGTDAGTAVQGNQAVTLTAGSGLTGGTAADALGDGVTATFNVGAGNGITTTADAVALGTLTTNWTQPGAFDIVLNNAGSELQILESVGGTYYGTFDVGDLNANQTFTFTNGGTVWTSGNDGISSTLDADLLDGQHASAFTLVGTTWNLGGNAGTNPAANYLGTSDAVTLTLAAAGKGVAYLTPDGNLGVGTANPDERLTVNGSARVLGASNPVAAGFISNTTNLVDAYGVAIAGSYAYIISRMGNSLSIYDVSDPLNIIAMDVITVGLNLPHNVVVAGSYAYVASYWNGEVVVFDVSDPTNIVFVSTTNMYSVYSLVVSGHYLYALSVYGASTGTLVTFDISDPRHLVVRDSITDTLNSPHGIAAVGHYVYVASSANDSLCVFDVSDPDNIVARGVITDNLDSPFHLDIVGNYVYVASTNNNRLAIFDVSDPDNIVARGYSTVNLNKPDAVFVVGRYAYVSSTSNNRLCVFDISNPDSIVALGFTADNLSGHRGLTIAGRYAYVASAGNNGLAIFDLDHLEAPTADIGSLSSAELYVGTDAVIGRRATIQESLTVGEGGAIVNGDMTVQGNLYAHTAITTVTGSTTLQTNQAGIVLVNNTVTATITLPSAASASGLTFTIKRLTTNAVTVGSAGGTIDGAATQVLAARYDFYSVISDGANWYIISR